MTAPRWKLGLNRFGEEPGIHIARLDPHGNVEADNFVPFAVVPQMIEGLVEIERDADAAREAARLWLTLLGRRHQLRGLDP